MEKKYLQVEVTSKSVENVELKIDLKLSNYY